MKLFLTTLSGAALLVGSALYAQTSGDHLKVHFNTPVMVGETTFPAGDCDLQILHGASEKMMVLRSSKTQAIVNVTAEYDTDAPEQPSVVLDRRGENYRLNRILLPDHTGYRLQLSE
jgi:hypothetical protein